MQMGILDVLVFVVFVVLVVSVGMIKGREGATKDAIDSGAAEYFLAGRGLTWWLIGISLIAANISAEQFVGMSGQAADYVGLAIASYEWLASVTLVVVAFAFLPYFLKTGIYTIPQFLEHRYNATARLIMAIFMMLILVGISLAGVIYAGALPMCELFRMYNVHLSLSLCCWLMGGLAAVYVAAGGLKACAWADLIQGTALILGGALITYFAFDKLGSVPVESLTMGDGSPVAAGSLASESGAFTRFLALNKEKLHMVLPANDLILPYTALIIGLWIPNFYYWGLNQYITQRLLGSASLREGQKGLVLAAFLKLIIPFVIVVPGIIAFNLYKDDMVQSASASPKTVQANTQVLSRFEAVKDKAPADGGYVTFGYDRFWAEQEANKGILGELKTYNDKVSIAASEVGKKTADGGKLVGIKTDTALNHLVGKLLLPGSGVLGFVLAALLGAIVSSLAAVLNAASTIFTMDIYDKYLKRNASGRQLVLVGRISIAVFVVIGCLIAPILDNPKFGGIFTYIQEFQGFVTPGILAAFIYGLLNRRGAPITGVVALLLNPVLYYLIRETCPNIAFLDRMAICMTIVLVVVSLIGMVKKLPQPVVFQTGTTMDLTPSRGAQVCGAIVVVLTALLYVIFR